MNRSVDMLLLGGGALTAGALALVAPLEVAVATLALLVLLRVGKRLPAVAAVVVVGLLGAGALRAERAVAAHEARRAAADAALGLPRRCTARAVVESSPVRARDVLRWDARLERLVCDGEAVDWLGRATLYGGPEDLARGDEADVVATLGAPQRLWNAAGGDPRP
ncbi:MAG TPA: hypothetical protein VHS09_08275, partial [Polyangiaceae bacterium]|nr:hypothetical protein [Polyangiaceae bacterium]